MGCSSGRLRVQQHYEPVGAVLAYLLAGRWLLAGGQNSNTASAELPLLAVRCGRHGHFVNPTLNYPALLHLIYHHMCACRLPLCGS